MIEFLLLLAALMTFSWAIMSVDNFRKSFWWVAVYLILLTVSGLCIATRDKMIVDRTLQQAGVVVERTL